MSTSYKPKDRYTIVDGIATIRRLNPSTGEPMATQLEIEEAFDHLEKVLNNFYATHPEEAAARAEKVSRAGHYPPYDERCNVLESITIEK